MTDRQLYLSPEDFHRLSGLSLKTVYRRIWDGSLGAVQPGGPGTRWLIPADALAPRPEPGRRHGPPA